MIKSKLQVFNNLTNNMRNKHVHTKSNKQPHLTVPDQSMSTKEILDRYVKGMSIQGTNLPVNNQENPENAMGIDVRKLGLVDAQEYLIEQRAKTQKLRDAAKAEAAENRREKADKKLLDENPKPKTTSTDLPQVEDQK